MRLFFTVESTKPLGLGRARTACFINQLATPGLGSMLGGRMRVGGAQLALAIAGVLLVFLWFIQVLGTYYRLADDLDVVIEPQISYGLLKAGVLLFVAAWLWALATSISLLGEARANAIKELTEAGNKPPVIEDFPRPR